MISYTTTLECVIVSFPDPQYVLLPCLEYGNETRAYGGHSKIVVVFTHTLHTQNTHRAVIEVTVPRLIFCFCEPGCKAIKMRPSYNCFKNI